MLQHLNSLLSVFRIVTLELFDFLFIRSLRRIVWIEGRFHFWAFGSIRFVRCASTKNKVQRSSFTTRLSDDLVCTN